MPLLVQFEAFVFKLRDIHYMTEKKCNEYLEEVARKPVSIVPGLSFSRFSEKCKVLLVSSGVLAH